MQFAAVSCTASTGPHYSVDPPTANIVLVPVTGCIAGVKFVPPSSLVIQPVRKTDSKASQACVPCRRDEPRAAQSSRFLWPAATTAAPYCLTLTEENCETKQIQQCKCKDTGNSKIVKSGQV